MTILPHRKKKKKFGRLKKKDVLTEAQRSYDENE